MTLLFECSTDVIESKRSVLAALFFQITVLIVIVMIIVIIMIIRQS